MLSNKPVTPAVLCREIGSFFGEYTENEDGIFVDTGKYCYGYTQYADMLEDWLDTIIEAHVSGCGDWEKEVLFIYQNILRKQPTGVRKIQTKRVISWQAYADICNSMYPHGKNIHLGTYNSIIEAILSRRNYLLNDIRGLDTTTKEGLQAAIDMGKARQMLAKKNRK